MGQDVHELEVLLLITLVISDHNVKWKYSVTLFVLLVVDLDGLDGQQKNDDLDAYIFFVCICYEMFSSNIC